jgi:group II intron reverse transcriptase/maturase
MEIWNKVVSLENLNNAWLKVLSNMGSPGIDKFTIKDFQLHLQENLVLIQNILLNKTYEPLPVLKIQMSKGNSDVRDISVLSVRDRIVHTAILNVIQPIFEETFSDSCFGYRPNKGANQAVNRVEKLIKMGKRYVLKSDIDSFFDSIGTEILYNLIGRKIDDKDLLELINKLLTAGENVTGKGILQGAPTSPLFSNIYLTDFDKEISKKFNYIRYADDFVILSENEKDIENALGYAKQELSKIKLQLNEEKTEITRAEKGFIFLGYEFLGNSKRPSNKAIIEFVEKISSETKLPIQRERIRQIINGWKGYFEIDGLTLKEIREKLEKVVERDKEEQKMLVLVATLIELNDTETAKDRLSKFEFTSDDPKVHIDAGILAFELGLSKIAYEEFLRALKLGSEEPELTYYLGLIYLNGGKIENAIKFLQKTVDNNPDFSKAYYALSVAYKKLRLGKLSENMLLEGLNLDRNSLLQREYKILLENEETVVQGEWKKEQLEKFVNLFSGREGIHAVQWIDNTGRTGYFPIKGEITVELVKEHLQGHTTLGVYVSRTDNSVNFLVFDIDLKKGSVSKQDNLTNSAQNETLEVANKIKEYCNSLGISAYIEKTGGRGHHCWIFFSEPLKAGLARDFGKHILRNIGELPKDVDVEIFPKQDNVAPEGLGSLIKLPLGIDRKTGRRSLFIGEDDLDQSSFVENIKSFSKREILGSLEESKTSPSAFEIGENCKKLLEKCNVLRYLFNKAKDNHELRHTERLIILYTFGHLGDEGKKFIHYVMSLCPNYNFNYTQKWINRLDKNRNPISCAKIRDWLGDVTGALGCFCNFDLKKGEYPTPLKHLGEDFSSTKGEIPKEKVVKIGEVEMKNDFNEKEIAKEAPVKQHTLPDVKVEGDFNKKITALLDEYLRLKKEEAELGRRAKDFEEHLRELLEEAHQDTIKTDFGILRIDPKNKKLMLEL